MRLPRPRLPRRRLPRVALLVLLLAGATALAVWRAPEASAVLGAFAAVDWRLVLAAAAAGVLAVVLRAAGWRQVLGSALPSGSPPRRDVLSAYSAALLANTVVPARAGEVVRVAALSRRLQNAGRSWGAVLGSVFTHRLLDVVPMTALAVTLLVTAPIPAWATEVVVAVLALGGIALAAAALLARRPGHSRPEGRIRALVARAREGLAVLRSPVRAVVATALQVLSWAAELLSVWLLLEAFGFDVPPIAAAFVLLMSNIVMAFPIWPGNVGLYQAATVVALVPYGVSSADGFAYGIALQALEVVIAVGMGLVALAREGASVADLSQRQKQPGRAPADPAGAASG